MVQLLLPRFNIFMLWFNFYTKLPLTQNAMILFCMNKHRLLNCIQWWGNSSLLNSHQLNIDHRQKSFRGPTLMNESLIENEKIFSSKPSNSDWAQVRQWSMLCRNEEWLVGMMIWGKLMVVSMVLEISWLWLVWWWA